MLVKANRRLYVRRYCTNNSQYCKVPLQKGHGIFNALGKNATKSVLGSLGKSSGSYAGKRLAKLIEDKTGSQLLGKVSKAALSSLGSLAGAQLGKTSGK